MSENRVIGQGNHIPWHLPEDFQWFKRTTMGHVLVMGRRTFQSIGRPLPGRETIVLSRTGFSDPRVRTITGLGELPGLVGERQVFVCGGAEVYRQALPHCSELYLTHVKRVVDGDVFFPPFEHLFERVEEVMDREAFRILRYRNLRLR